MSQYRPSMDLSIAAQARLAAAAAAADLSEQARTAVPVHDNDAAELVEIAARLVSQAEEVQRLAIAAARETGHSWEDVGTRLGTSPQDASARYDATVAEIHDAILFPSRRGSEGAPGWWACPDGLEEPQATITRLDVWVDQRRQRYDPARGQTAVSAGIHALSRRYRGVTGTALVTKLVRRIIERTLPDGVTEEDARILLLRAKVVTFDAISQDGGHTDPDAQQLAQDAYDELVEIHRGRTRGHLTVETRNRDTAHVLLHDTPIAAIVRTDSPDPDVRGWWLWGLDASGEPDAVDGSWPQPLGDDPHAPLELAETAALDALVEHIATDQAKGISPFADGGIAAATRKP